MLNAGALSHNELAAASSRCNLTAAVFAKEGTSSLDLALVYLDEDDGSTAARIAASGYHYCGTIAVIAGKPHTEPEPGPFATAAVMSAGVVFAGKLGLRLRELQLEQLKLRTPADSATS